MRPADPFRPRLGRMGGVIEVDSTTAGRHMHAEIAEQPSCWRALVDTQNRALEAAARLVTSQEITSIVLVGRGSSDHAATYGQYLCATMLGHPAGLATPSVTSLTNRDLFDRTTLVVAVSQSGASPDLVATMASARRTGSPTLSITNDPSSELARTADVHIDVSAGEERSVAATKTYTAELVALHAWVRLAAGESPEVIEADVRQAAAAAEAVISTVNPLVGSLAEQLVADERIVVIGRGLSLGSAKEAALKLIETCAVAASGWSAADAKHGPLGQVVAETPVFLLAASPMGRESVLAVAPDVVARGGRVFPVGAPIAGGGAGQQLAGLFPDVHEALIPMLEIIPLQQLALELALLRGRDPDRPTGLTKVTRTL